MRDVKRSYLVVTVQKTNICLILVKRTLKMRLRISGRHD